MLQHRQCCVLAATLTGEYGDDGTRTRNTIPAFRRCLWFSLIQLTYAPHISDDGIRTRILRRDKPMLQPIELRHYKESQKFLLLKIYVWFTPDAFSKLGYFPAKFPNMGKEGLEPSMFVCNNYGLRLTGSTRTRT